MNPIAEITLADLRCRNNAPGLVRLTTQAGALAATSAVILSQPPILVWVAAMAIHAIVLVSLFAPLHETSHDTAFRSDWLNRAVRRVLGFMLIVPAGEFRYFHLAHHRHTQDPARDPELASPKPASLTGYALHLTALPYWWAQIRSLLSRAAGHCPDHVPARARARVVAEARAHLAAYAVLAAIAVAGFADWLIVLWFVPLIVGQPVLRAYLLAEHGACPLVADMLANTRTTYSSGLVRWLFWNMPYHTAHHVAPDIPFHRLGQLDQRLADKIAVSARSYPDAHRQIVAALPGRERPS